MTPIDAAGRSREMLWQAAIWASVLVVFALDLLVPAGYAEWVFYLVPLGFTVMQRRAAMPFAVTGVVTVLMVTAYFFEPGGVGQLHAEFRRVFALLAAWIVGLVAFRAITDKAVARRLMWVQQGRTQVTTSMLGELTPEEVGRNLVRSIAEYSQAVVAAAYRVDEGRLVLSGGYALEAAAAERTLAAGEGIAGQVLASRKPLQVSGLAPEALRVSSATVRAAPAHVIAGPILEDGEVAGVIELGFLGPAEEVRARVELLDAVAADAGRALRSALYRERLRTLLAHTQQQAEELQAQQEELRVSNEELEEQGGALRESQARLETQQAELEQTNVQLEEQTQRLERQKQELLRAQEALEENARALERSSTYKSEFLANMSHELRTPLNSSLILAKLLADNGRGNLDEEQVRFARTIHSSNSDLLALINDILDLSKIEAGQVEVMPEPFAMQELIASLQATFAPVAADKGLALRIESAKDAPAHLVTDRQRLEQVLRNLLSNALKFTEKGGEVVLQAAAGREGQVAFAVRDNGIGIPAQQQEVIFEAFRQADGTTSRQYGGTGLGLSISRELARLLGGAIRLQSAPGLGSTFTLEIPAEYRGGRVMAQAPRAAPSAAAAETPRPAPVVPARATPQAPGPHIDDDRTQRTRPERLILVVEDDQNFARILYDLAHELDFDCVHASTASDGLELARRLQPSGILLDVSLPGDSGLAMLERIKRDPTVRHIPVHMVSVDDHSQTAPGMGAVGYAIKPVARDDLVRAIQRLEARLQKRVARVLVVEDDAKMRDSIARLLKAESVEIETVGTVKEALARLEAGSYDCLVTDLELPDASGYELLEQLSAGEGHPFLPVIVYTGRALTREEETRLRRYSRSIIIKGARSPERLLDEVTLFLHRVESSLPEDKRDILQRVRQRDEIFEGRRILLAEDDVRNIFALSRVFEPLGAQMEIARNGQEAVDRARKGDIDLVLMDIMMPVKDGLAATRELRAMPDGARLPIIAITAKAMAEDRRQCLEAGANDYIAKPIDVDKLVSLCRVWMPR